MSEVVPQTLSEALRTIRLSYQQPSEWRGWIIAAADTLESRDQRIKELEDAARAVVDYSESFGDLHEIPGEVLDRLARVSGWTSGWASPVSQQEEGG